jgi:hypothetical protein
MSQLRIVLNFGKSEGAKSGPATLPLRSAILCIDCETLSNATGSICPGCGGTALMSVAEALGGALAGYETAKLVESYEGTSSEIVRNLVESATRQ